MIDHFSPRFRRPQSNIDVSIELQQRPVQNITPGHSGPDIVEAPEIRDKQVRLASVFLQVRKVNNFFGRHYLLPRVRSESTVDGRIHG